MFEQWVFMTEYDDSVCSLESSSTGRRGFEYLHAVVHVLSNLTRKKVSGNIWAANCNMCLWSQSALYLFFCRGEVFCSPVRRAAGIRLVTCCGSSSASAQSHTFLGSPQSSFPNSSCRWLTNLLGREEWGESRGGENRFCPTKMHVNAAEYREQPMWLGSVSAPMQTLHTAAMQVQLKRRENFFKEKTGT